MAKINDFIVFLLSYFPFLYAGLVTNPEDRYKIGWAQVSLIGSMFLANMTVVLQNTIINMMEECRRRRVENYNFRMLKYLGYDVVVVGESIW